MPWAAIATAGARYRSLPANRSVQTEHDGSRAVLNIGAARQTSVDLVLHEPLRVGLPKGPSEPVREIRLYADDPSALVARVRHHLATPAC
ncbi:hypothetical protein [Micromonospora sp. NPDC003776]